MKKIAALLLSIAALVTLVACTGGVKVDIVKATTTSETIIVDIKVEDKKDELVEGSIIVKAFLDGVQKSEQKTYDKVDDEDNTYRFRVGGLTYDTAYDLKVFGTIASKQVELIARKYTTQKEGSNVDEAIGISTKEEFLAIKDSPSSYFVLKNDVDFTGTTIKAEDFFATSSSSSAFKGNIDGGNFSIKNLNLISTSKPQYLGLFGYINGDTSRKEANIKDLTLENINIISTIYFSTVHAGILAGRVSNTSAVENIQVINSSIKLELKGNSATASNIGGVIGHLEGKATNLKTENVDIDLILGGVNSVNVGGAIGYVYHSSNPKALEKISADGNISFNGLFSSSQSRAIIINIGGAIGNYNIHKNISEVASNVDITVPSFHYTSREGVIDGEYKRINDSLRVGGLFGEVSSNYQINKGFYSGSISVNSNDDYGRIEEIIVSGLIARSNKELDVANLSRLGTGKKISVSTQTKNKPALLVSDVDAFALGISAIVNYEGKVYGASENYVNGILQLASPITPGDGITNLDSEYLTSFSSLNVISINNLVGYGQKVSLDVRVSDIKGSYNLNTLMVAIYDGTTKVTEHPYILFDGKFSGLTSNKEYIIKVLDGATVKIEKTVKTLNVGISYTDELFGLSKIEFTTSLIDSNNVIKEDSQIATLYENGIVLKKSIGGATDISFTSLRANSIYYVLITATIDGIENVIIDGFAVRTKDYATINSAAAVDLTATTISFNPSVVVDETLKIDYNTLSAKIYQNNIEVDSKSFINNVTTPENVKFTELSITTVYRLVITATVDGVADVVIGVVGDGAYQTTGITALLNTASLDIDATASDKTVDLAFTIDINDLNDEATRIKVELWYNGKIDKAPVDYIDGMTIIAFTNLRENAVVSIRITAIINGVTVVIGEQSVSLVVN